MSGNCFLVIGPSGAGKSSLVDALTSNRAITTTTRKKRDNETDGIDYHFITKNEFKNLINNNLLVEWTEYGKEGKKNYYGLTIEEFKKRLSIGDLFIICTIDGVNHYKQYYPQSIILFIFSSFEDIKRQLYDRGGSQQDIQDRISLYNEEIKFIDCADFVIENGYGYFDETLKQLKEIVEGQKKQI